MGGGGEGSLFDEFNNKNISLSSSRFLFVCFLYLFSYFSFLGYIFCGWMTEFEDKAIKSPRNIEPTTTAPTLMFKKVYIYSVI